MEWDQETCIQLINEYRKKEVLWNPRDPAYYNKLKKEDAWKELREKFGKSIEELKKKIDSLKGSYRREKTRAKTSMGTGKGRHEMYKSKWFAYESLQFLEDKDEPRRTPSNLQTVSDDEKGDNEAQDETEERGKEKEQENEQINEELVNPQAIIYHLTNKTQNKEFKFPKKRSVKQKQANEDPRIAEAFGYLRQTALQQRKDQCSLFGDYIADKLRSFDNHLRAVAQHRISNLLFELEMHLYENSSTQSSTQSFSVYNNFYPPKTEQSSTPVSNISSPSPSPQRHESPLSNSLQYFSDSTNDSQRTE
ncbi:PREDICTED: uncharacterized protein LOC105564173 [Vollenhovia emeryi]|uniref:uncharacterized protein LOC105564173 n=1 Tax=Vollenhovia emeryi TaxID=411798 RepID=UPI0005F3AFEE|nr:PREDICTED: uncharacterized protein LOC105564173 [Vollenhovia emeryi]